MIVNKTLSTERLQFLQNVQYLPHTVKYLDQIHFLRQMLYELQAAGKKIKSIYYIVRRGIHALFAANYLHKLRNLYLKT